MQSPDRERLDSISELLAQVLRRQDELERRLSRLELAAPSPESLPASSAQPAPTSPAAPPLQPSLPQTIVEQTSEPPVASQSAKYLLRQQNTGFETRLGLTIVNRVGVITLVIGVAFFFKWAVDNGWIGPAARVILGTMASFAILGVADLLWRKGQQVFAQGITGTGVAVLYLALYSAFGFYHLIGQAFAFALLVAVTCLAVALSVRYNSAAITALGFFGGYLTPLLLSTGEDRPWFLFSYVLLLDAAAIVLARRRSWRLLEIVSFVATSIIYGYWLLGAGVPRHERLVATVALLAFFAIYSQVSVRVAVPLLQFLTALAISFVWEGNSGAYFALALAIGVAGLALGEARQLPAVSAVSFGSFWLSFGVWSLASYGQLTPLPQLLGITIAFLMYAGWQVWQIAVKRQDASFQRLSMFATDGIVYYGAAYILLHSIYHEYLGVLALALSAVHFGFAAYLHRRGLADLRPLHLSLGMAVCFIAIAIQVQFTGFTITVAWSLQAAALAWLGLRFKDMRATGAAFILLGLVALRLIVFDSWSLADPRTYSLIWNTRFLTFAAAASSFFFSAFWTSQAVRWIAVAELIAGHTALLWGLTLEIVAWANRSSPPENVLSVETVATSILFGVYALILVGVGVSTRTAINRISGLSLLAFVIVKLYVFDVWQLERVYRISGFVILGVLLIATSFLYSRFRQWIEGWLKSDRAG